MNKLNIKEANEHLKQLHRRVIELENQVHMHALHSQELEKTNAELRARLEAAELSRQRELEAKDAQNAELVSRLGEGEARVDVLLRAAEERDRLVEDLEVKARLFYEVVEHRAALGRIVEVLDEIHKQKRASEKASPASPAKLNGERLDESNRTSPADSNGTQSPPYLESPHVNSIT
ncbi:Vimentin-type intermediate filament-associated coiled-coil protein [Geodia barretti]|uniref:Vimentin-type intermediate filament-associated coiled-coil protein n=1 Tax=Geodia barretti TaxID=519541 RepID=A0AA35S7E9_GEOBA|nr:Vimentin-type intermediate filament-associated coiled-coil protein [Geodia barretti]